jgi:hypothetical protein
MAAALVVLGVAARWQQAPAAPLPQIVDGPTAGQNTPGACGYYTNSNGHAVSRPCGDWRNQPATAPSGATALCGDGKYSFSEHPYASGTCSYHGGVLQHLK